MSPRPSPRPLLRPLPARSPGKGPAACPPALRAPPQVWAAQLRGGAGAADPPPGPAQRARADGEGVRAGGHGTPSWVCPGRGWGASTGGSGAARRARGLGFRWSLLTPSRPAESPGRHRRPGVHGPALPGAPAAPRRAEPAGAQRRQPRARDQQGHQGGQRRARGSGCGDPRPSGPSQTGPFPAARRPGQAVRSLPARSPTFLPSSSALWGASSPPGSLTCRLLQEALLDCSDGSIPLSPLVSQLPVCARLPSGQPLSALALTAPPPHRPPAPRPVAPLRFAPFLCGCGSSDPQCPAPKSSFIPASGRLRC